MSLQNNLASVPLIYDIKYEFEHEIQTSIISFISVLVHTINVPSVFLALMYNAVRCSSPYLLGLSHITPPLTKFVPNLQVQQ